MLILNIHHFNIIFSSVMSNGNKLCIAPLIEVCAIIGSKVWDKNIQPGDDKSKVDNGIQPGESALLSVVTSEKIVREFQDDPDLCISNSISWSALNNLPAICFPYGVQLSSNKPDIKIEYGVFTDETGSRLYMYCLCFPVLIHVPDKSSDGSMFSMTKLCFFSSHKCFILMRDIFQSLNSHLKNDELNETEVQHLLVILSKVFVPPKGTLDVGFGYKDKSFVLNCQIVAGFSDAPLSLPFMFFDHKSIVEIIVAIISEQQLVFVSNDPSTRVLIMECFLSCIFPFEWLAPYFPLLTENLYCLLDAMGYFIFGADRSVLEEDHEGRRIVFIDIDNGTISYCGEATRHNFDPTVVARLKERLPGPSFNFLCTTISKIFDREKEYTEAKEEFDFLLNVRIFLALQYVLIDIYKGLLTFQMSAKKKMSLNKLTEYPGYQLTPLQTHLKDTMMRSNLRIKYNNPYLERQYFALLDVLKKKPIKHVLNEIKLNKRCNELITFTPSIDENLKSVELKLTTSDRLSDKSSLLYLRALLLLNNEEPILAFQSINKIFEAGVKNFPAVEVMILLRKLENLPNLYSEIMKQNFMQQAVWAPLTMELGPENYMKSKLSDRNYNHLEFPELMLEMGITRNHGTARQIFKALKSDSDQVLGQDAKNFCEIWSGLRKYLNKRIYLPVISQKEKLVKYSEQDTKCDTGIHLVCSIFKLYFVDTVTQQVCDFMNIDEMTDIKIINCSQMSFQSRSRKPKEIDNIKHASRWCLILEELISATNSFQKTKDHTILVDARAAILIFDSLHQYELKYGELLDMSEVVETDASSSNFFVEKVKHSGFLTYQKKLKMNSSSNRSVSTFSSVHCGLDNILSKFSPNPKIKETIEVIVADSQYMYIGTRTCSLHKVSMSSFDVEDHISMMLPDNENWTLYEILLIDDNLWIAVKYRSLSRSLHIMKCDSFDNYQTLPLFNHNDHIVSMKRIGEFCFITSMDGLTSIWSIETKSMTRSIQDCQSYIFTVQVSGNNLLQSVRNGFSACSDSSDFALHETGFTLTKFVDSEELGHIYGIDKAAPDTIRCFSSYSFIHLKDLDIHNTIEEYDQKSFYNMILHGEEHLVLTTRNCSLIVYNLVTRSFERCVTKAHMDLISCGITTEDDKIITGSRSLDGTVTVWVDMFDKD